MNSNLLQSVIFFIIYTLSIIANGEQNLLDTAQKQYNEKQYFSALETLQKIKKTDPEREEGLYLADKTVIQILHDIKSGSNYFKIRDSVHTKLKKMRIPITIGHYENLEYDHTYWKQLKNEFPKSKHIPEIEYGLINVYSLEDNVTALKNYIKLYPQSIVYWDASLQLARIYDDLWEQYYNASIHPPLPNSGAKTKGSKLADQQEAAHYKKLATEHYQIVQKKHSDKIIRESIATRLEDLKNNKPDGRQYAAPD